jgi:hypothetical protein
MPHEALFTHSDENNVAHVESPLSLLRRGVGVRFRDDSCIFIIVPHEALFTHSDENNVAHVESPLSLLRRGVGVRFRGGACIFIRVPPNGLEQYAGSAGNSII